MDTADTEEKQSEMVREFQKKQVDNIARNPALQRRFIGLAREADALGYFA